MGFFYKRRRIRDEEVEEAKEKEKRTERDKGGKKKQTPWKQKS